MVYGLSLGAVSFFISPFRRYVGPMQSSTSLSQILTVSSAISSVFRGFSPGIPARDRRTAFFGFLGTVRPLDSQSGEAGRHDTLGVDLVLAI